MHVSSSSADKVLLAWPSVHDFYFQFVHSLRQIGVCSAMHLVAGCHVGLAVGRQASWLVDVRCSAAWYSALLP